MRNTNQLHQVPTQAIEQMKKNPVANAIDETLWRVNETLERNNLYGDVLKNAQDILAHARLEQELAREINRALKANTVAEMLKAPKWNIVELAWEREINIETPNKTVELAWLRKVA